MPGGKHVARACAIALLLAMLPSSAQAESRLEQTRREIRATRARLSAVVGREREVAALLNRVTAQLRIHQGRLNAQRAVLGRLDLAMRAQQRRIATLEATRRTRENLIAERARMLYIMGPGNALEAMADARTLEEFLGRASALDHVLEFDQTVLQDIARVKDQARKERAALAAKRREALEVKQEIAERLSVVSEMAETQAEAHSILRGQISRYRNELAALQREQTRILSIIRSRSSVGTGPVSTSGFAWPIRGRITSPYGPRWGGFHTGMDIDCRTGDGIGASKAGTVIAAEYAGGYGNMVIIDHGNGVSTLYAHNSRLYVGRGQSVSQRQRIAACGSTGNSTGDHLHFEVRVNGQHRNPRPFLP